MWIVKNLLRGILTFEGLDVSIPPKGEFDLDTLGREEAEASNQIQVAFEEGYLQNIYKEEAGSAPSREDLDAFKRQILEEMDSTLRERGAPGLDLDAMRQELASVKDEIVGDILGGLEEARSRLAAERKKVLASHELSDAEVRARLAFLEEQEQKLEKNFEVVGRQQEGAEGSGGDVMDKADLLGSLGEDEE